MNVTIRPLDVSSDHDLAQLNALAEDADAELYGGTQPRSIAQCRVLYTDWEYARTQRFVAEVEQMEGGTSIVALGSLTYPLHDNEDTVFIGLTVHPAFRGQGIGTALVEEAMLPAIRASDRTLLTTWGEIPADGDPDDPAHPWNHLAARLGMARKNVGVCRGLAMPVDPELLDALDAEAAEKQGEYRIELWDDVCPEEHLAGYGALLRQLDLDDPAEDLEYEAADYTPERIRSFEERRRDGGMRAIIAVAIAPDGTIAGNSEIYVAMRSADAGNGPRSTLAWQENTLVMPDHRGHRLGLAMKVATHRLLSEQEPQIRSLITWNSHVNPWMISVNEKLGYTIRCRSVAYQGRLEK